MSMRSNDLLDRAATLVAGLALAAIGALAVLWPTHAVRRIPDEISTGPLVRVTTSTWWPWGLAGAGVLLVLIGLVWLVSHVPSRKAPVLRVPGTADLGVITVNLDGVASAAASALEREPDVQSAKGKAVTDRGIATVELTVTVAHPAGLSGVITAVNATSADIARATGTSALAARTVLQVAKAGVASRKSRNLE
ncbi:hypothetical protein SBI67_10055 [Mycolicibacterium sp. 120266]|uniref:hypothetical protein n=1 Tax=Mycolicibacterium sp. 120266 TaxID=3090601 RepID=UPI00299E16CD|nr:hypothetical protein [Mycolicibacterium sp. 120266]MDX1872464.1 hypothetical protein [Mycolicibacterium sp. 120266]